MRFIRAIIFSVTLTFLSSVLWAHGSPEELGHHWEVPAYRSEMRFQIILIGAIACISFITLWLRQIIRKKGVEK